MNLLTFGVGVSLGFLYAAGLFLLPDVLDRYRVYKIAKKFEKIRKVKPSEDDEH